MPRWLWVAIGTASIARSICSASKPSLGEPFAGEPGDHLLGAGAGGHALGLDPGQRPRAAARRRPRCRRGRRSPGSRCRSPASSPSRG